MRTDYMEVISTLIENSVLPITRSVLSPETLSIIVESLKEGAKNLMWCGLKDNNNELIDDESFQLTNVLLTDTNTVIITLVYKTREGFIKHTTENGRYFFTIKRQDDNIKVDNIIFQPLK